MTLMMKWGEDIRPQKAEVRRALVDVGLKRSAIFLPGNEALCVREALAVGSLRPDSALFAVECQERTMEVVRAAVTPLFHKPNFHLGYLTEFTPPQAIDFALIDLMGSLDTNLAAWLRKLLVQHATPDFDLGLVVTMNWRNCGFTTTVANRAKRKPELWALLQEQHQTYANYILGYSAVLRTIFHGYDFDFKWPIPYKDSRVSMLAFRLHNFRETIVPSWPNLASDLLKEKAMSRIGAGKRAWETRRKNAEAEKRSQAAHKAWATRRQQQESEAQQAAVRSAAAHKAWATRRGAAEAVVS